MDSTKPASRSTRRCLDTIGCGMPSCRSISPTDCCDETSRLRIARRFGSAMIANTDSILFVYSREHIRVKVYKGRGPGNGFSRRAGMHRSDLAAGVAGYWILSMLQKRQPNQKPVKSQEQDMPA